MEQSKETERLVQECADFNCRMAKKLENSGLDFLIWVSPTSCRDPEGTKLWQPFFLRAIFFYKFFVYLYLLAFYFCVGIVRTFTYRGFYYRFSKNEGKTLLIIPDEITDHSDEIKTNYLIEESNSPLDKIVFSRQKNIGSFFSKLNFTNKTKIALELTIAGLEDFILRLKDRKITREYFDAFIIYFRWVISQSWQFHWDFYYFLKEIVKPDHNYKILLSLHEMHFYSKIMWRFARENNLIGVTAQHAMIVPEKLWYFSDEKEIQAKCPLPDLFFVYSDEIKKRLQPFYPETRFFLCCSPRFTHWKIKKSSKNHSISSGKKSILFVSAIMYYDAKLIIQGIKKLLDEEVDEKVAIKIRLHPHGIVNYRDKLWLKKVSKRREIEISSSTLNEDLSEASLVIGCNSTVLQESILLGIPVLSLFNPRYVKSTILPDTSYWSLPANEMTWKRVLEQTNRKPDKKLINRFKENMGLFSPDLTSSLIENSIKQKIDK